jgi:hypothetical protein
MVTVVRVVVIVLVVNLVVVRVSRLLQCGPLRSSRKVHPSKRLCSPPLRPAASLEPSSCLDHYCSFRGLRPLDNVPSLVHAP